MKGRNAETQEERMEAWQHAVDLYRGPFLHGHNDDWIVERREDFRAGYLEALTEMAHVRMQDGMNDQALTLLQKALAEDNTREDLHREIMRLYNTLGRRSEAAGHYKQLVELLESQDREPSQETHELYQHIIT
jgi:DNA-binding SARP family transcriptional activator